MLLVADANVFASALVRRGFTLELFFSDKLQIIVPEFIFAEIEEHKAEILSKSGVSEKEFELFINLLITRVEIIPSKEFLGFMEKAKGISPDPDDVQYFALALKYKCAIWSNDSKFKEQSQIEIFSTDELVKGLKEL